MSILYVIVEYTDDSHIHEITTDFTKMYRVLIKFLIKVNTKEKRIKIIMI